MTNQMKIIEREVLPNVSKPLRYIGTEYNSVKKKWDSVKLRTLFAFPDIYEVGMSHLGLKILYHLVNDQPEYLMERVFAPWTDMEKVMRERNISLFSLESCRPIAEFDCIGITLQYEMSYTNILNMLNLGGIPLLAADRDTTYPLIMGGGPCACNPEPLAAYFDFFVLGEGEEVILDVLAVITRYKSISPCSYEKNKLLIDLAKIEGVYVPALFKETYDEAGQLQEIKPLSDQIPGKIGKRVIQDLNTAYFPVKSIVPYLEIIHDRIMLEILRGCSRGCRFCQAGMLYRPVRERSPELLEKQAKELIKETGYNEISLTSLSSSDYTCIKGLLKTLLDQYEEDKISVSLPSLRVDAFSMQLAKEIQRVKRSGLTFAPEAGTQRLRDVINKGVTEENIMEVTTAAFESGWTQIKLYFMIGLPTETAADLDGIAELAYKILHNGLRIMREKGAMRQLKITVSVSSFVPKAHTPFQWEKQNSIEVLKEKQQYLRSRIKDRRINYNYHEAELSALEAIFARGDRNTGKLLLKAWEKGCKFDSWSEHFSFAKWQEAIHELGMDISKLVEFPYSYNNLLPWEHLDMGVTKKFLWQEREKAYRGEITEDCRFSECSVCGACQDTGIAVAPAKKAGE